MWKAFYDPFLQGAAMSWGQYMSQHQSCGRKVRNTFQADIYPIIGLELLVITVLFCALYYWYLNGRFGRYYSKRAWIITLFVNSLTTAVVTFLSAKSILDNPSCSVSTQLIWITLINGLYAAALFFLLSLGAKRFSPMGKRTPF